MARTMQDIILEKVEETVNDGGYELVVNFDCSNKGFGYVLENDLTTVCYFNFNFQSSYACITVRHPNGKEIKDFPYLEYNKKRKIDDLLKIFENYCLEYSLENDIGFIPEG